MAVVYVRFPCASVTRSNKLLKLIHMCNNNNKSRSRATRSAVARKESSRSSPKKPVPTTAASFKSLTLTLPPEQLKESYREKSPTSVTDLADFPLEAAYMCSPDNFHTVAFLGGACVRFALLSLPASDAVDTIASIHATHKLSGLYTLLLFCLPLCCPPPARPPLTSTLNLPLHFMVLQTTISYP